MHDLDVIASDMLPLESEDLTRAHPRKLISLVATHDDRVVGHILFSRMTVANATAAFSGVGLAPVAVLPEFQRQRIGSIVREGLAMCRQAGYDAVVVLGNPAYYSCLGFIRAADFGLQNEYDAHG